MYKDSISINQMKSQHKELVAHLYSECSYPFGYFLMTGTGIGPTNSFTLASGDVFTTTIEHIGTLINTVAYWEK